MKKDNSYTNYYKPAGLWLFITGLIGSVIFWILLLKYTKLSFSIIITIGILLFIANLVLGWNLYIRYRISKSVE